MKRLGVLAAAVTVAACGSSHKPLARTPRAIAVPTPAPTVAPDGSQVIANGRNVSWLTAYGGYLVFSRRDDQTSRYSLVEWHDGQERVLPVAPRALPFDADAGPDADGRPVVVYSACAKDDSLETDDPDWNGSSGCRIMQLRLDAPQQPQVLASPGGSATTPSVWRGRLAYAVHRDGQSNSRLMIRLRGQAIPRPLALPESCAECDAWVESLDLGARAAALVWRNASSGVGTEGEWILQINPLDGSRPHQLSLGYDSGACGYVRPLLPTAAGLGAFWTAAGSPCEQTVTDFAEQDTVTGRRRVAGDPGHLILGATRDAAATYWLRGDRQAKIDAVDMTSCEARGANCVIVRGPAPKWRTLKPGQRIGPHPG